MNNLRTRGVFAALAAAALGAAALTGPAPASAASASAAPNLTNADFGLASPFELYASPGATGSARLLTVNLRAAVRHATGTALPAGATFKRLDGKVADGKKSGPGLLGDSLTVSLVKAWNGDHSAQVPSMTTVRYRICEGGSCGSAGTVTIQATEALGWADRSTRPIRRDMGSVCGDYPKTTTNKQACNKLWKAVFRTHKSTTVRFNLAVGYEAATLNDPTARWIIERGSNEHGITSQFNLSSGVLTVHAAHNAEVRAHKGWKVLTAVRSPEKSDHNAWVIPGAQQHSFVRSLPTVDLRTDGGLDVGVYDRSTPYYGYAGELEVKGCEIPCGTVQFRHLHGDFDRHVDAGIKTTIAPIAGVQMKTSGTNGNWVRLPKGTVLKAPLNHLPKGLSVHVVGRHVVVKASKRLAGKTVHVDYAFSVDTPYDLIEGRGDNGTIVIHVKPIEKPPVVITGGSLAAPTTTAPTAAADSAGRGSGWGWLPVGLGAGLIGVGSLAAARRRGGAR